MLNRLRTKAAVVVLAALSLTIGGMALTAPPAAADGNGVQNIEFLYVQANNSALTAYASCPDNMPAILVVNIDNGHSNNVTDYDAVTPSIRACHSGATKVLGYVTTADVWDEDSDSNTTEMRTQAQVGADVQRWTSPFTSGRDNASKMVDGIFLDQMPADCGTSNANVTRMDQYVDSVESHFTLWSYGDPLIVANAGAPIRDCHPGWESLGGDVPDLYMTFEGTPSDFASWPGNLSNGSSYYSGYPYFDKFVHVFYDADEAEAEQAIIDSDTAHAAYVGTTDDVMNNPWDVQASYIGNAVHSARHDRGVTLDEGTDIVRIMDTGVLRSMNAHLINGNIVSQVLDIADRECGVQIGDAEFGDQGSMEATVTGNSSNYGWSMTYDSLDATFVDCVGRQIRDNSANTDPNEPMGHVCNDIVTGSTVTDYDCSNADDSSTSNEVSDMTAAFREAFEDNSDVERLLVLIRDMRSQDSNTGSGSFCESVAGQRCLPRHYPSGKTVPWYIVIVHPSSAAFSGFSSLNDGSTVSYSEIGFSTPNP